MKTLFFNADVYTGEGFAKSFIIEDGKFLKVFDEAQPNIQADEKIDLNGKFVCAGFNDSHMHLLNFGQSLVMARLHEHTDSLAGIMNYVSEFLKENPVRAGQWLRGRGWNQDYFTDVKRMPSKSEIGRAHV